MADFDFSTLVTDRSQADLETLRSLLAVPLADWTEEQLAQFNQAASKGAYNYTDLNRVTAAMDYLNEVLTGLGYQTGYQRVKVPHKDSGGGGRLPEGYTELEYIESTGTQYVDTGILPGVYTLLLDFQFDPSTNGVQYLMGHTANQGWYFGASNNIYDGGLDTAKISLDSTQRRTLKIESLQDSQILTIDGQTVSVARVLSVESTLSLFKITSANYWVKGKLYGAKITQNGELIRDFVPCINPSDEIGLYDIVNDSFYGNSGSGVFYAGPPLINLPDGYTQLEYIQSTGSQYIDTGLKGNQNFCVEVDYSTESIMGALIGADEYWGRSMFTVEVHFAAFSSQNYMFSPVPSGRHIITLNKGTLSLDGKILTTMSGVFETPVNLTAFALNRNGSIVEFGSSKLYYIRIFNNDKLIRFFVPCSNGESPGLYDAIENKFYGNIGSGEFIAGPEIATPSPDPDPEPEYDPYLWYEGDTPTTSLLQAYLANVRAMRGVLRLPENTPEMPADMVGFTQEEANNIERILDVIYQYLTALQAVFLRAGMGWAVSGGPGYYFENGG